MISAKIDKLISLLKPLYDKNKDYLLFHGWHHLKFVRKKAFEFADSIKELVQNHRLRKKLSRWGIKYSSRFEAEVIARRYMKVYEKVLQG